MLIRRPSPPTGGEATDAVHRAMTPLSFVFRPDMKVVVHEVDGQTVDISGRTIDIGRAGLSAMLEVVDTSPLRAGATARCSYVEPAGVHAFETTIIAADPLSLNHRKVRVILAMPGSAERIQRRQHVRVPFEVVAAVLRPEREQETLCQTIDLGAGGLAIAWPSAEPLPAVDEVVQVRFRSDRFAHDHLLVVRGASTTGAGAVVRGEFAAVTAAERDRIVSVVFAIQRAQLRQQRGTVERR